MHSQSRLLGLPVTLYPFSYLSSLGMSGTPRILPVRYTGVVQCQYLRVVLLISQNNRVKEPHWFVPSVLQGTQMQKQKIWSVYSFNSKSPQFTNRIHRFDPILGSTGLVLLYLKDIVWYVGTPFKCILGVGVVDIGQLDLNDPFKACTTRLNIRRVRGRQ